MELIKKLFIKNYKDVTNPQVRFSYGIVAGVIGIVSNILLFAAKLTIGLIVKSITIVADAVNNISDAGSSAITVFGFKMASRPADKDHPYGHARFEYISGLIVAIIILVVGILLGKESITKIIDIAKGNVVPTVPSTLEQILTYVILGLAIVGKLLQMLVYRNFGKSINSDALLASSQDSRNDVISTAVVVVSSIVMNSTGWFYLDGIAGAAVSVFIIVSSIMLIKETIDPLLGEKPDPEIIFKLRSKIMEYDGVLGTHDIMVHSYGAGQLFAVVHVEVSAKADIMASHDTMDQIEHDVKSQMGIHLAVHMDPIDVDNPKTQELRLKTRAAVKRLSESCDIHDFRVVYGVTHTNILFDVVIPFEVKLTKEDVESAVLEAIKEKGVTYFLVIDVDRSYI